MHDTWDWPEVGSTNTVVNAHATTLWTSRTIETYSLPEYLIPTDPKYGMGWTCLYHHWEASAMQHRMNVILFWHTWFKIIQGVYHEISLKKAKKEGNLDCGCKGCRSCWYINCRMYVLWRDLTAEMQLITRTTLEFDFLSIQLDSNPSALENSFGCTFHGSGPGLVSPKWVDLISWWTWQGISSPIVSYSLPTTNRSSVMAYHHIVWSAWTYINSLQCLAMLNAQGPLIIHHGI